MGWWSTFLLSFARMTPALVAPLMVMVFPAYAAWAVGATSDRPVRAFKRLALACAVVGPASIVVNVLITIVLNDVIMKSSQRLTVPLLMAPLSLVFAVLLRWVVGNWKLSSPPLLAFALATCVYLSAVLIGKFGSGERFLMGLWLALPLWHFVCGLLLWTRVRRQRSASMGRAEAICCSACGYPLTGLTSPERCPECGATFAKAT